MTIELVLMVTGDWPEYARRGAVARAAMRGLLRDDAVAARLDGFLGLGLGLAACQPQSSPLLAELAG